MDVVEVDRDKVWESVGGCSDYSRLEIAVTRACQLEMSKRPWE